MTRERVPVYAVWQEEIGPLLSLGVLTAAARYWEGGRLSEQFELRRPETAGSFLADLEQRSGPAILLCSDYVWSLAHNLQLAREARRICPELTVIHGGPSVPRDAEEAEDLVSTCADVAHVLVRGEGEESLCELLSALGECDLPRLGWNLRHVRGITFRAPDGTLERTPDRDRIADLDRFPSPYLVGEYAGIDGDAWRMCLTLETNRGCPYGCTFCDWGSLTNSRIRTFSMDRVGAELEWASANDIVQIQIADANFGILARDVEIARMIADQARLSVRPWHVYITPTKNTPRYIKPIFDHLLDAGVVVTTAISLQTTDPATLANIRRSNISTDSYVRLAADLRRRGVPLAGDVLIGLPGQTYETFRTDLQFFFDHEIMPRIWPVQLLPNAPMNDKEYRERYQIRTNEENAVVSTTSFSHEDRARMLRIRLLFTIADRYGVLRHLLRYLQWDHGLLAAHTLEELDRLSGEHPLDFPLVGWLLNHYDLFPTTALNWPSFYAEIRELVGELGVKPTSGLECVLSLQEALMPASGRTFPMSVDLDHDYVGYYQSATRSLFVSGAAGKPTAPLEDWPPATFVVEGDPLDLCHAGQLRDDFGRGEQFQSDFYVGSITANELASPLARLLPGAYLAGLEVHRPELDPEELVDDAESTPGSRVALLSRRRTRR